MYRKIEDFISAWETESSATQKLMDALTDDSLRAAGRGWPPHTGACCLAYRDNDSGDDGENGA